MISARDLGAPPLRLGRRRRPRELADPLPVLGEGLLPFWDPLTIKELKGLSRHWQSYVGRVLYVGLVACVLLRWWSETVGHPEQFMNSEIAVLGRTLFTIFAPGQMLLVALAAISAGSDMITKEVRAGTLGLLHLGSVSPGRIIASKWKAVMLSATSLMLSGLPVMASCIYLGGVGPWEVMWSFTLTWVLAALGAAFSIGLSARSHSPLTPIVKSAAKILGSALVLLPFSAGAGFVFFATACVHPLYAAVAALIGRPGEWEIYAWIPCSIFTLWYSLRVLRTAGILLRARVLNPPPPPRPMNDPELLERNYRRLTLGGPRVVTVQRRIWNRHELLWKEWMTRPATRLPLDARCAIGVVLSLLLWVVWACSYEGRVLGPFYFLGSVFLSLAALNGAVLFRGDAIKIDMLHSTPLSTRRILFTKLFAGLCSPEALFGIVLAMAGVMGWFWEAGPRVCALAAGASLLYLLFAFGVGAAASLCSSNVRSALLVSGGILGLLAIGVPWIASTLLPLGGALSSLIGRTVICVSVTDFLEGFRTTIEQRAAGVRIDADAALWRAVPFVAVYSGLLIALLAAIFVRFRRLSGRN
jgi:ABC-type transport system involved in multi-copper enzyme maturation permease subunit